ncbi:hypothetical protein LEP1GSC050_3319 [Leptospira broomii serovar Hurstbridge str. 5399]|uniref:Uncharacterized protein n=1 Tax=Leptospira broomii serovar Hurstbridge str. 5399 TaxID=1049789 RepID=T0GK29_9LEPT|nr:hypothetical protein [Leptospira broomii]EQA45728.1 hypothetical protein LEP1GSC050_3319 [Leptospira broomii serovar Hurstbridge str. 5399]
MKFTKTVAIVFSWANMRKVRVEAMLKTDAASIPVDGKESYA